MSRVRTVKGFVGKLRKRQSSATVTNPYRHKHLADNLEVYLDMMLAKKGKRIMLVGEAPGYKGCAITGIPFSSGRVFTEVAHPLLNQLGRKITLKTLESENTASIVWRYLAQKSAGDNAKNTTTPLFWNSFPFHPHPENSIANNRAPNSEELTEGAIYLDLLQRLYQPQIVAGIGKAGVKCARSVFPDTDICYIRHPSYGGKAEFCKGMDLLIG